MTALTRFEYLVGKAALVGLTDDEKDEFTSLLRAAPAADEASASVPTDRSPE